MLKKKFIKKSISPLFIILAILASNLSAQTSLIEVKSAVDTAEIFIGDRINYSIVISHQAGLRVEQPGEGLHLGAFEIKEYNFSEPEENEGIITQRFDFTISVYDTGQFTIPAFPVAYFPDTTMNYKIIEASPIDIFVKSVLSGEEAPELKDVKPPIEFPLDYVFMYSMLAVALLIVLAGWFGYRAWKQKQEKGFLFSPPPKPRPAHEIALEALEELYGSDLLESGQLKIFYIRLTEILRNYLEGRYYISAMEETTDEIIRDLIEHIDEEKRDELSGILKEADLVKFAKHKPQSGQTEEIKQQSERFIQETKLVFEEQVLPEEETVTQ
ncbi:MAG: hypothetical protein D8M58_00280 [Calditrichaeota bacterium]|nr:MAG: hypothetical protein DWQ03_06800 [Calditrichota bacterium]MBL1203806.1 hypothetical protein [Calditrichota bacterium]NOG43636.1 hypothetical protein [Calditrichota bacterium]